MEKCCGKSHFFDNIFRHNFFDRNPVGNVHVFPHGDRVEKSDRKSVLNLIAPHLGSTVGRVVYHSMATAAGAAVDVSAVFAMTLAAYQQQRQRSMATWNLIMDGYDDDTELDAENDESTREMKRRCVYKRKYYKTSGWWQELQNEDLSDHTSRAAWRFRGDFRAPYCLFEELVWCL